MSLRSGNDRLTDEPSRLANSSRPGITGALWLVNQIDMILGVGTSTEEAGEDDPVKHMAAEAAMHRPVGGE